MYYYASGLTVIMRQVKDVLQEQTQNTAQSTTVVQ